MAAKDVQTYWASWAADNHFGMLTFQTIDKHRYAGELHGPERVHGDGGTCCATRSRCSGTTLTKKLSTYNETPGEGEG
jgi:hypothetical protein